MSSLLLRVSIASLLGLAALSVGTPVEAAVPRGHARNIDVRMHGRTLVVRGAAGKSVGVSIQPTRGGLRLTSDAFLNGRESPLVIRGRPKRLKLDMGRTYWGAVSVVAPADGVAPLRLRGVDIRTPRNTGRFHLIGIEVSRHVRVRANAGRHVELTLLDSHVIGRVKARLGNAATTLSEIKDSRVDGGVDIAMSDWTHEGLGRGRLTIRDSVVSEVSVDAKLDAIVEDSEFAGDVWFAGASYSSLLRCSIQRDLRIGGVPREHFDGSFLKVLDCEIEGAALFEPGIGADEVELSSSAFGSLQVDGGTGDDLLTTTRVLVRGASEFDGGDGDADRWSTDDDGMLDTVSVETLELQPLDE